MATVSNSFEQLLNVFWLRPETAMWRELDIQAMREFVVESPSLDIGCGDGVFSFIRANGQFDKRYDAFRAVENLDRFFQNVDIFDAYEESYTPLIVKAPCYQVDEGFDHKDNLLNKANQLGLYRQVKQGDANKPLPYSDNHFKSIFSNIVYWLDDPEGAVKEIARILAPGGTACLMLPNAMFPEYSFYNQLFVKTQNKKWQFLEKLDRGRFADNIRQSRQVDEWMRIFENNDLKVESHKQHLSKLTIQMWDIGLRPLFPVLLKMANAMDEKNRMEIKKEWIETLIEFLGPVTEMDGDNENANSSAFSCFILKK